MEMGSNKCTLRKEIKNEIAKYIDNEFMNETMKEIVNYIKTTSKVVIDDSNYDESDIDSRVELKDNGAFNIHDYMYVKDFLYELSWEGSYVEVLEEDEGIYIGEVNDIDFKHGRGFYISHFGYPTHIGKYCFNLKEDDGVLISRKNDKEILIKVIKRNRCI